ncbi:hypothetical protein NM06_15875 [Vibrio sinaloensis]|uniref:Uncharacterized protein n=1 Tax=Photobacterium sp. (strain ATCC 43367) TaxID=379097 RepID=A0A0A5JIA6_PHOS4|nr:MULTISPECIES: hypothetical protein [Vibrio]KGY07703.1 hypothetical protein NM06_15875 [Vibrio sinaloensis]
MQVSDPIHLPCPDMAGMVNPDPKKRQRSISILQKLREEHGLNQKRTKGLNVNPLTWRRT